MRARDVALLGGVWSPRRLFGAGEQGVWYDPSDLSSMFQDSAGTTPAAVGQPVGLISDKSGRGNHASQATPTSRPTLQSGYASFDGTDDSWATGSINFSGTGKITVISALYKNTDAAGVIAYELSANANSNNGSFFVTAPRAPGSNDYSFGLRGTQATYFSATSYVAPIANVISCVLDLAGSDRSSQIVPRINGVTPTLTGSGAASSGGAVFGNYPLYIGRRGGSSLPFNGRIYGLIIVGRALTASEISQAERWMAAKAGVSL